MKIRNIKKSYGKKHILKNISFDAERGQCIGILGGNGCGKSTLLSILAGVQKADSGKAMFDGTDLLGQSRFRIETVGYVPQNAPLFAELCARDNLRLWYERDDMKLQLEKGVLKMLGITEFLKVPVRKMSGGMKKRLAIGCAVSNKPKILLLDEPGAALDLPCKEKIIRYLNEFKSNGGIVVLTTHDMQELPLCDKMYILKNGTLTPYYYDGNIHRLAGSL